MPGRVARKITSFYVFGMSEPGNAWSNWESATVQVDPLPLMRGGKRMVSCSPRQKDEAVLVRTKKGKGLSIFSTCRNFEVIDLYSVRELVCMYHYTLVHALSYSFAHS